MQRNSSTAAFESLESRRLLSGASLSHGVLFVHGNVRAQNTINVNYNADASAIDVTIDSVNARGVAKHFNTSFPKSLGISSVRVVGGAAADTINVNQVNASAAFPATQVIALAGNDTITTGAEDDFVLAGAGDDVVNAGDGANRVRGGLGMDSITTGVGNDRIDGGQDNDTVHAGDGNDVVRGGLGDDRLDGGAGDDTLYGEAGNDTLLGGVGNDTLWGAKGDDAEDGGDGDDKIGGIVGRNALTGGAGRDTFVVVSLDQQASQDYDAATDVLTIVPPKANDGATPPAI